MDNTVIEFYRGGMNLPSDIVDGSMLFNVETGQMMVDTDPLDGGSAIRKAMYGNIFGISETSAEENIKTFEIAGVPKYFTGLQLILVFKNLDHDDERQIHISVQDTNTGTTLPAVGAYIDPRTSVRCTDLKENVPYIFIYLDYGFVIMNASSLNTYWERI